MILVAKRKTHEQFISEVYNLVGNEYEVIGKYVNTDTKIEIRHNKCNSSWLVRPYHFTGKKPNRCPECAIKANANNQRKTHEKFVAEVKDLVGNEYEIIGRYINTGTKIEIKHNECGYKYPVTPNKFLNGRRCPECANKQRALKISKTHEQFVREVFELVNDEYEVLGKYNGDSNKVSMKHNICDKEYPATPTNFLQGARCPHCFGTPKKSTEQFVAEVYELVGDEYEVLEEYTNRYEYIKIRHNACESEYKATANNFLKGRRCPKCFGNIKRTTELFKEEVYEITENEYEVLGEYLNSDTKTKMKHKLCGKEWEVTPSHFLKDNSRCPKCKSSKGEKAISQWLDRNNVKYEHQYRFNDCKDRYKLPFDFAILNNETLTVLIEFDGRQHFESVSFFGGEEGFKSTMQRDKIKNDYCKKNNIPLLRIPYWEFNNIEDILKTTLSHLLNKSNK